MLNQLDKERLCESTHKNVEVRSYGGASINSLYTKLDIVLDKNQEQ